MPIFALLVPLVTIFVSLFATGCFKKGVQADDDETQAGIRQEAEDREGDKTRRLENVDIVEHVNSVIKAAHAQEGDDGAAVAKAAFNGLGAKVKGSGYSALDIVKLSAFEVWLEKNLVEGTQIVRLTWKESRYGGNKPGFFNWKTPTLMNEGGANHAIVPTIKLGGTPGSTKDGTLVGIDKWAHYFNTGYLYFANAELKTSEDLRMGVSQWLEGDPKLTKGERARFAPLARSIGYLLFGFLGSWSTGVISFADMYASEHGFRFYDELAKNPKGFKFSLEQINLEKMNEEKNPSTFIEGLVVEKEVPAPKAAK